MLVRILYAAVALSVLGAFPRSAYRSSNAAAPADPAALAFVQAPTVAAAPSGGQADCRPAR
jgi:hypothetical protein